ncbi:MAG: hypothetical protein JXR26_11695 [Balneolaceae bacterium]|nr:hypothetical protein [Balneolaceae bacterium]
MKSDKINIDEENTQLIWGLVAVVSIAAATYMLTNAFMAGSWHWAGYKQLMSMALFIIGFYGITRISTPLYHFVLSISESTLQIEIWQESEHPIDIKTVQLNSIEELRIAPHTPRAPNEALFDFSTSYYLLYKTTDNDNFKRFISLEGESFTLKVDDIKKVMDFLVSHNPAIHVPDENTIFLNRN